MVDAYPSKFQVSRCIEVPSNVLIHPQYLQPLPWMYHHKLLPDVLHAHTPSTLSKGKERWFSKLSQELDTILLTSKLRSRPDITNKILNPRPHITPPCLTTEERTICQFYLHALHIEGILHSSDVSPDSRPKWDVSTSTNSSTTTTTTTNISTLAKNTRMSATSTLMEHGKDIPMLMLQVYRGLDSVLLSSSLDSHAPFDYSKSYSLPLMARGQATLPHLLAQPYLKSMHVMQTYVLVREQAVAKHLLDLAIGCVWAQDYTQANMYIQQSAHRYEEYFTKAGSLLQTLVHTLHTLKASVSDPFQNIDSVYMDIAYCISTLTHKYVTSIAQLASGVSYLQDLSDKYLDLYVHGQNTCYVMDQDLRQWYTQVCDPQVSELDALVSVPPAQQVYTKDTLPEALASVKHVPANLIPFWLQTQTKANSLYYPAFFTELSIFTAYATLPMMTCAPVHAYKDTTVSVTNPIE